MVTTTGVRAARPRPIAPYENSLLGMVGDLPTDQPWAMPDIIEWVCGSEFLNRGSTLYPRQGTLLKLIFLADDLMTSYDHDVLDEWASGFALGPPNEQGEQHYEPVGGMALGITPDWRERIAINKAEGRLWFREAMLIVGRRGSKGHMGALCGSRVLYQYLRKGDPQGFYGIDRDKRLQAIVFAGKRDQAKVNQWRDLVNVIVGSPALAPYVSKSLGESLTVFANSDTARRKEMARAGVMTEMDLATFEMVPKESTLMAGRGPTSFMQFYDEMAHVIATGANRSAEEVYQAATPSLDQFGVDGFIYIGTSPWQMTGQAYEIYAQSLAVDPLTLVPLRPEMLMVQLESWDLYKDWEIAHKLPMVPEGHRKVYIDATGTEHVKESTFAGKCYPVLRGAIQEYDAQMRRLERANPDTFRVERRSQWATALDAYLDQRRIEEMFGPFVDPVDSASIVPTLPDRTLVMQTQGRLNVTYVAHGDPSKSGANFGFAIAHPEGPDYNGLYHVVFDLLHAWLPPDFPDGHIDYIVVEEQIGEWAKKFMPSDLTFDQFNSVGMIQRLQRTINKAHLPKRVMVSEQTATAPLNWKMAETFKTALGMGLIHAPYMELAELELRFLQLTTTGKVDHPSAGPVQTKDVADAMFNVVYHLIGEQMGAFIKGDLASVRMGASQEGGFPLAHSDAEVFDRLGGMAGGRPAQHAPPPTRVPGPLSKRPGRGR